MVGCCINTLVAMRGSGLVRCQRCGKPIGYVTVLAKGLTGVQQSVQNVKVGCGLHGVLPEKAALASFKYGKV